jgi:hypothetical protein
LDSVAATHSGLHECGTGNFLEIRPVGKMAYIVINAPLINQLFESNGTNKIHRRDKASYTKIIKFTLS